MWYQTLGKTYLSPFLFSYKISGHQQSRGYEDGPWKGPGPPLLVAADLIHKPPESIRFTPIKHALAVTVEPFKFSPAEPVAYELRAPRKSQALFSTFFRQHSTGPI